MNIALIGLRCAGKTTIGRILAEKLHRPFVDLDDRVRAAFAGESVMKIWQEHGEAMWRFVETTELRDALEEGGVVLALGGGAPMTREVRGQLNARRQVNELRLVYLQCSEQELLRRRAALESDDRPPLANETLEVEVARTLSDRHATFEELADYTIDVSDRTAEESAARIALWFKSIER